MRWNDNDKELTEGQKKIKEASREMISAFATMAHMNRAYYEFLVEIGFTKKEAFELTKIQAASIIGGAMGKNGSDLS